MSFSSGFSNSTKTTQTSTQWDIALTFGKKGFCPQSGKYDVVQFLDFLEASQMWFSIDLERTISSLRETFHFFISFSSFLEYVTLQ